MGRNVALFLTAVAGLLLASPVFAQEAATQGAASAVNWVAITSGFAVETEMPEPMSSGAPLQYNPGQIWLIPRIRLRFLRRLLFPIRAA